MVVLILLIWFCQMQIYEKKTDTTKDSFDENKFRTCWRRLHPLDKIRISFWAFYCIIHMKFPPPHLLHLSCLIVLFLGNRGWRPAPVLPSSYKCLLSTGHTVRKQYAYGCWAPSIRMTGTVLGNTGWVFTLYCRWIRRLSKKGEGSEGVKICGIGSLKNKKTFTGEKDATSFF